MDSWEKHPTASPEEGVELLSQSESSPAGPPARPAHTLGLWLKGAGQSAGRAWAPPSAPRAALLPPQAPGHRQRKQLKCVALAQKGGREEGKQLTELEPWALGH